MANFDCDGLVYGGFSSHHVECPEETINLRYSCNSCLAKMYNSVGVLVDHNGDTRRMNAYTWAKMAIADRNELLYG